MLQVTIHVLRGSYEFNTTRCSNEFNTTRYYTKKNLEGGLRIESHKTYSIVDAVS